MHASPTRRRAALALLAACACGAPPPAPPAARNAVLVVLDTLRPDHLGTYGYGRGTSPNLDAFAAQALVFEDAQSAAPWTAPALHSLVTGLYPSVHGVVRYPNPGRMSERVVTLAEVLRERGRRTAAFTEGGYARGQFGLDQGFEHFPENEAFQEFTEGRTLDRDRLAKQVDEALAWLRAHASEPFFLMFHTYRPHIPWDAPEEEVRRFRPGFDEAAEHAELARAMDVWNRGEHPSRGQWLSLARHLYHCNLTACDAPRDNERFNRELDLESRIPSSERALAPFEPELVDFVVDLYDAAVRHTDSQVCRLWEALAELGRAGDTLVAIASDHGEGLGQHGRMQHGKVLHEELTRVVLLLRVPDGPLAGGRRVPELVRSVDLVPTVLELLGIDAGLHTHGRSLVPLVLGDAEPLPAVSQSLNKRGEEDRLLSIRTPAWRLVLDRASGAGALYDRRADPLELVDVADRHPEVVRELRAALERQEQADEALRALVSGEVSWEELDAGARAELDGLGYTGD